MTVALFSFFGIIIGASLQYLFTKVLEEKRHYRDLRARAYADYVRFVSEAAHCLVQPMSGEGRQLLAKITDAKARLCLYGSTEVVNNLAEFDRAGGEIKSYAQRQAFVQLLRSMRSEADITNSDLEAIMLREPPAA